MAFNAAINMLSKAGPAASFKQSTTSKVFTSGAKGITKALKEDTTLRGIHRMLNGGRFFDNPSIMRTSADVIHTSVRGIQRLGQAATKLTKTPVGRGIIRAGGTIGFGVAAIGMLTMGMMKGVMDASTEIVTQRAIQDQRYARNITMMSRLGHATGSNSINRFNHTAGLTQALSANRHGRGGY